MKKVFALVCLVLVAFNLAVIGFAHPGGTDGNGGHYNKDTGEYHYHHGYSAHQHPNGVCPYKIQEADTTTTTESGNYKYHGYPAEKFKGDIYDYLDEEYNGEGVVKEYRAGECTQENCPFVDEAHGHILRITTTKHTEKYDYKKKEDESFFGDVISKEQCQALGICIGIYISICVVGYIKNKRKEKKRSRN